MNTPRVHPAYSLEIVVSAGQMRRTGQLIANGADHVDVRAAGPQASGWIQMVLTTDSERPLQELESRPGGCGSNPRPKDFWSLGHLRSFAQILRVARLSASTVPPGRQVRTAAGHGHHGRRAHAEHEPWGAHAGASLRIRSEASASLSPR